MNTEERYREVRSSAGWTASGVIFVGCMYVTYASMMETSSGNWVADTGAVFANSTAMIGGILLSLFLMPFGSVIGHFYAKAKVAQEMREAQAAERAHETALAAQRAAELNRMQQEDEVRAQARALGDAKQSLIEGFGRITSLLLVYGNEKDEGRRVLTLVDLHDAVTKLASRKAAGVFPADALDDAQVRSRAANTLAAMAAANLAEHTIGQEFAAVFGLSASRAA